MIPGCAPRLEEWLVDRLDALAGRKFGSIAIRRSRPVLADGFR